MIRFDKVVKYLGGHLVLDGITFEVDEGETFVIVGPSGAGKSVTLSHITGLMTPDSGSVIVDGQNVSALKGRALEKFRSGLGMLFQSGALINWMSVEDNIALPLVEKTKMKRTDIRSEVDKILSMLELEGINHQMPSSLSGGMRKRVGLARALIMKPRILLYDEPTSGLDPVMSRKIDGLILSLVADSDRTSLVVTHDMNSALSIGDRIAMLYDGRIVECAPPEEFLKSDNPHVQEFMKASGQIP